MTNTRETALQERTPEGCAPGLWPGQIATDIRPGPRPLQRIAAVWVLALVLVIVMACDASAGPGKKRSNKKAEEKASLKIDPNKLVETSGVARIPGGFALFSDEVPGAFLTKNLSDATTATLAHWGLPAANDQEAAGVDSEGALWICTSHSVTRTKAKDLPERRMLIRVKNPTMTTAGEVDVCRSLRETITRARQCPPVVKASVSLRPDTSEAGFNIEGIALVPRGAGKSPTLLVGLRSPLVSRTTGNAYVARIDRPNRLFKKEGPRKAEDIGLTFFELPLSGLGIRDLYWDDESQSLLAIGGAVGDDEKQPVLFRVTNPLDDSLRKVERVAGLAMQLANSRESFHPEAVVRDGSGFTVLSDNPQGPVRSYRIADPEKRRKPGGAAPASAPSKAPAAAPASAPASK